MAFIAKFKVQSVLLLENDTIETVMKPVIGENPFTQFTPTGEIKFVCTNPEVNVQIAPGKVFEVVFRDPE